MQLVGLCLNPYCNGRRYLTFVINTGKATFFRLNPYCNGRRYLTPSPHSLTSLNHVLILIVMEDGI